MEGEEGSVTETLLARLSVFAAGLVVMRGVLPKRR